MISLFIDTASSNLIIYLLKDNEVLSYVNKRANTEMSVHFFPELETIFNEANIKPVEVDKIFIVTGPGSFTGVRIGLTFAKLFALLMNKNLIPISSLELLATTNLDCDYICSIVDARRGYVYAGMYDQQLNPVIVDQYIKLENLLQLLPTESRLCFVSYDEINGIKISKPEIDIPKIVNKHKNDPVIHPHVLKPNYLKNTEAEEKLNKDYDKGSNN